MGRRFRIGKLYIHIIVEGIEIDKVVNWQRAEGALVFISTLAIFYSSAALHSTPELLS